MGTSIGKIHQVDPGCEPLLQTSLQATKKPCAALGCAKEASRRGFCVAHYHADRRANPERVEAARQERKRAKKKASQARYRAKAAGEIREYMRRYHSEWSTRLRDARRLAQYKMTREAFETLLAAQGHACALCAAGIAEATCHIDHCHETGRVRGLLCSTCNKGLGWYERFSRLGLDRAVAEYIKPGPT
jgi:hypothetical protein